jgi:signal transduction histidine kinase
MPFSNLWRTTTFRLTALYGLVFVLGTVVLLGLVYLQATVYLSRRTDDIIASETRALAASARSDLRLRIAEDLILNGDRVTIIGLFAPTGTRLAGNLDILPLSLRPGGPAIETPPNVHFPSVARLRAQRLATGEILVVGRDVSQLLELRAIVGSALVFGGLTIIFVGLGCGVALSVGPLRRLRELQEAGQEIALGDLKRRMPISRHRDELDMLAATVNSMMGEVERLMAEVKGATDVLAHDLMTPLTRASTQLHRIEQTGQADPEQFARINAEVDEVLDRFRAILRITELESRTRRAGFARVDLMDVIEPVAELYGPLAEERGVWLTLKGQRGVQVQGDPKLLIEAASNLVDNAIKFSGAGGAVQLRLGETPGRAEIVIQDNGPGIPIGEREAVLQRFYRSDRNRLTPGSGLGLSVVAAICKLHVFALKLEDAEPGLRVVIDCGTPVMGK